MAVQGLIKAVLSGRFSSIGVQTKNVFYYGCQIADFTDYQTADYTAVEYGLEDIASNLTAVCGTFYTLEYFDLYYWNNESWMFHSTIPIVSGSGLLAEEGLPTQVAALLRFTTDAFRMIGHKYLAGFTEPSQEMSQLVGTTLTALIDVAAAIMEERAAGGRSWYPGIPGKSSAFAPFRSCIILDILSTMRRRKIGVGI